MCNKYCILLQHLFYFIAHETTSLAKSWRHPVLWKVHRSDINLNNYGLMAFWKKIQHQKCFCVFLLQWYILVYSDEISQVLIKVSSNSCTHIHRGSTESRKSADPHPFIRVRVEQWCLTPILHLGHFLCEHSTQIWPSFASNARKCTSPFHVHVTYSSLQTLRTGHNKPWKLLGCLVLILY